MTKLPSLREGGRERSGYKAFTRIHRIDWFRISLEVPSDNPEGRTFALHVADPDSMHGIPIGP